MISSTSIDMLKRNKERKILAIFTIFCCNFYFIDLLLDVRKNLKIAFKMKEKEKKHKKK